MRKSLRIAAAAVIVCVAAPAFAAEQPKYLDIMTVKVKPEKQVSLR